MEFDVKKEFDLNKKLLREIIISESYVNQLHDWVINKNKSGYRKRQIYDILCELHADVQKMPDPEDKLYDRIADFLDMFTSWAKGGRILPEEPDV